jgi:MMP 1-O-methyltransferase
VATGEFEEVRRLIAGVGGWLTDHEAKALFEAAEACTGRGVIVEIGSWRGKSTICLARGSRAGRGVPVYAIDLHAKQFERFKRNLERAGIADLVHPIRAPSQEAADDFHEPVELLFVDGSHEEALVREDFEKWVPKVVEGGIVAFHDTTWHRGPRRVVGRNLYRSRSFRAVRFVRGSMSMGRKVPRNTAADRAHARVQLAKKTVFWLATLPAQKVRRFLPKPIRRRGRRLIGLPAAKGGRGGGQRRGAAEERTYAPRRKTRG